MKLAAAVFLVAQSLTPSVTDSNEHRAIRQYRLTELSHAIAEAAESNRWGFDEPLLAGMLLSLARRETELASYVWHGCLLPGAFGGIELKFGHCDPDPDSGMPQSLSYFQLKQRVCPELFRIPQGTALATREAARCAARALVGAYFRCLRRPPSQRPWGAVAGAFSGYGYSTVCDHPSSPERAFTAVWMSERIRANQAQNQGTRKSD